MKCHYCGKELSFIDAMINDKYFCHAFDDKYPTCYMLASWEGIK